MKTMMLAVSLLISGSLLQIAAPLQREVALKFVEEQKQ